jgi:hypothetical protein
MRAPVRLNQNRNDRTARAGAGRTELASQSEAARITRLFATEQSGINGTRLHRRIGGIPEEYRETYRNRGTFYRRRIFYKHVFIGAFKPSYSTPSISLSLQSIDTSKH